MSFKEQLEQIYPPEFLSQFTFLEDPEYKCSVTSPLARILNGNKVSMQKKFELFERIYVGLKFFKSQPNGAKRAEMLHRFLDNAIAEHLQSLNSRPNEISCGKGCSHCCYMEVIVTDDEAIQLAKLVKSGIDIDMSRLKFQSKLENADEWQSVPKEKRKCVFLGDDNLCRVYESRPLQCRKYFVTSPPANCEDINGTSTVYTIHSAEIITSAALNLKPTANPLAQKLLEKLK